MAKLIAQDGELQGLELPLEGAKSWVIGRDPDVCQILVEDPSISRRHIAVHADQGEYTLENLSSTSPAQINGNVVEERQPLQEGDLVKLGNIAFQFTCREASPQEEKEELEEESLTTEEQPLYEEEQLFEGKIDTIFDEDVDEENLLAEIDFDIPEDSRWLLKVISGPNSGAEFHLQPQIRYIIGSDSEVSDIVFYDTSVSKKHAGIKLQDDETIFIEDLHSKNGVAVDGEKIEGKTTISPNSVISMGTTSFVVFDRESEMQTIISPLMPSIVNALKKREEEEQKPEEIKEEQIAAPAQKETNKSSFVLIAAIMLFFLLIGLSSMTLFQSSPVDVVKVKNPDQLITAALTNFPGVQFTYNPNSQTLLVVGHVLTETAKKQLNYKLEGLSFIKQVDDTGIIIDELVWKEMNTILAKNPDWRGVSIQANEPGRFVLTGNLKTRKQKEELSDYLNSSFPYLDRLQSRLVVEEDLLNDINNRLSQSGLRNVNASLSEGNLVLKGRIATKDKETLDSLTASLRETNGIRNVEVQVVQEETLSSIIDITNRYFVSGISRSANTLSVVVDGKILSEGDFLDGMEIVEITPAQILLEKDGTKFRIRLK